MGGDATGLDLAPEQDRAPAARPDAERCLRGRRPHLPCDRCARACGVAAIRLGAGAPRIDPQACLGCGACAAACPTGAITAPGFTPPRPAATLRLDCARVPPRLRAAGASILPCLAGVTPALLLAEQPAGAGLRIEIMDRGWCAACPAAAGADQAALAAARLAEAFAGIAGVGIARLAAPLDPAQAAPPGSGPERDRRALFRRLLAGAPPAPTGGVLADRAALAARDPDAPLHPALHVTDRCADHGVCSAACPTGALARAEEEGMLTLRFAPGRCIACGRCAELCPEQALALAPRATASAAPALLRATTLARCWRCDSAFVPQAAEETECPGCRKDAGLFHDLRRSLAARAVTATGPARHAGPPDAPSGGIS